MKRPKPGETEDDLLRQQEDFISRQQTASATVVKRGDKRKTTTEKGRGDTKKVTVEKDVVQLPGLSMTSTMFEPSIHPQKKKSRFKEQTATTGGSQRVTFDLEDDEDPEEAMDRRDTHVTSVLSKIMEREANPSPRFLPKTTNQGFPTAPHRGTTPRQQPASQGGTKANKKQSLFAQQFESSSPSSFGVNTPSLLTPSMGPDTRSKHDPQGISEADSVEESVESSQPSSSLTDDRIGIHQENLSKLSEMTEADILEEQKKLKAMLDPSLLSFMQSRNTPKSVASKPDQKNYTDMCDTSEPMDIEPTNQENCGSQGSADRKVVSEPVSDIKDSDRMEASSGQSVKARVTIKEDWVHMDKTEPEKLEWMKDLPKPSAKSKEGSQARFDFNGRLIARDADISVRTGLHHHGDEQEVPGYSLEELFTLSRSAVTQQQVLALQTLARIIYNCRLKQLGGELLEPLLPQLLKSGILFLLRWSLDSVNEGVIASTMEALAALLIQPGDEGTLDRVFSWHRGMEVPPMLPISSDDDTEDVTEEGEEIQEKDRSDPHIAEKDAIKGLLRMTLLPRLRYILEVVRPPAPVVLHTLAILIRICRHSQEASHQVMRCPRLLQTIFTEFLPMSSWKQQDDVISDVYGYPVVSAMKLIHVLCLSGRNITASLLSGGKLMSVIMRYITIEPADMQLNIAEAYHLSTISLHTWRICVSYGLACDEYRELYPLLMQQLQLFQRLSVHPLASTEEESDVAVHRLQMTRACALFGLLEGVVNVAGTATELQAKLKMSNDKTETASSDAQPVPPCISWSHVSGLQSPVELCVFRWLVELTSITRTLNPEVMDMVSCLMNLLASFYDKYTQQACYRPVDCLQTIEKLVHTSLVPFMTSATFYSVMVNLKFQSSLRYEDNKKSIYPSSLPDFGCDPSDADSNYPSVRIDSTCGLAIGLLRLVHILLKIHKGVAVKFCPIVENTYVTAYLKAICKSSNKPSSRLCFNFARFEHQALHYLLRLYHSVAQQAESCHQFSNVYHSAALTVFARLLPGDEYYVQELMSSILFNTDFIAEGRIGDPIAVDLAERLQMTSSKDSQIPSLLQAGPTRGELLEDAYKHLPSIRNLYMVFFGSGQDTILKSKSKCIHQPHEIDTYIQPAFTGPLLPVDWMFLPLLHLHTEAQKAELHGKSVKALPSHILSALVDTLRWIFMVETWRPKCLKMVPQTAKIARIFCVFLIGSDLFLEDTVRQYLNPLLRLYTKPEYLKLLDFDAPVPGVTSFYDLFMELLTQYEAVSFGDALFAHYILLPLQQRFDLGIRKGLWGEHAAVLRSLGLPIAQLILPIDNFLHPEETNPDLLSIYMSSLISGVIKQTWSPIMYLVALHHLNVFLFSQTGSDQIEAVRTRLRLLRLVMACKDQVLLHHITCYQGVDLSSPLGFSLYPSIPSDRSSILQAAQKR
ncbi:RNA polymerase II-associated protein 1-like isoform X2 [Asterias rubens]|uniref:RNA polymerase II-associated protein 1-like isoform X2 n=1 Tax=Asterias rubens TaxID=7604 RepID=UPI0014550505|nr:RNA polymerase II-associated protein 1-like isoform X2 [Asterias rubens]